VTLLDGVTGSGKTEVYFEAVAAAIRAGQQVLVLLFKTEFDAEARRHMFKHATPED